MLQIKPITDFQLWDKWAETSPQGTIFCESRWLELIGKPYQIWGVYKGKEMIGGIANFDELAPLTPFQGILMKDDNVDDQLVVARALLEVAPKQFYNHYTFTDIRPFKWAGWQADVKYTYVMQLDEGIMSRMQKKTRYEITSSHLAMQGSPDIEAFCDLYHHTFGRKGLSPPVTDALIQEIHGTCDSNLYMANDGSAGAIMIRDTKRSYYILGASDGRGNSSFVLGQALLSEGALRHEVDLVGCNDEKIGLFKRGFGGELKPYYGVRRV